MSYQVLARKWRPKGFDTLVGQEHVVRALTHALDQQRLHHAWLFTGTRGVGKTTLSRILAKSLNCIGPDGQGDITSKPCGVCRACTEIDAGRFVDYIEMDAASNRGVDEMAHMLEQAVYAPSNARFKVYMIDEVHMLTNHAFNAMLKTLEEPPPHIKFILATTDPQKIPVTVLSRCLQFNLKQMPAGHIVSHLDQILHAEGIPFEHQSLRLLANAASGSMRDALSLTDQAIAYSAGEITEETVRSMLGALDQTYLIRILDALAATDGVALLAVADEIAARSLSFNAALQDLAGLLHRIALVQTVPAALADDLPEAADIRRLAELFSAEEIQLDYQIATHGRSNLGLAPDEYAGFTMTLMRMLAFRPSDSAAVAPATPSAAPVRVPARPRPVAEAKAAAPAESAPNTSPASEALQALKRPPAAPLVREAAAAMPSSLPETPAPVQDEKRDERQDERRDEARDRVLDKMQPALPSPAAAPAITALDVPVMSAQVASSVNVGDVEAAVEVDMATPVVHSSTINFDGDWLAVVRALKISGFARQMIMQAELLSIEDATIRLRVPIKTLLDGGSVEKVKLALAEHFQCAVTVVAEVGTVRGPTLAATEQRDKAERQSAAEATINADPFVQALLRDFGARVVPGSIRPL